MLVQQAPSFKSMIMSPKNSGPQAALLASQEAVDRKQSGLLLDIEDATKVFPDPRRVAGSEHGRE